MKKLAALFLVASATAAQAQGIERGPDADKLILNNGREVVIPHCEDQQGRRVRFVMDRSRGGMPNQVSSGPWSILSVFTPLTGPQVLVGPGFLTMPYETAQFTVEHECHHHASGDMFAVFMNSLTGAPVPSVHDMEFSADCAAAKAVRDKYGFSNDDLRAAFRSFPQHNGTATHPATAERLKRSMACLSAP